jgi:hypothetical protein
LAASLTHLKAQIVGKSLLSVDFQPLALDVSLELHRGDFTKQDIADRSVMPSAR